MRKMAVVMAFVAAAALCGCTSIRTTKLQKGMTVSQVNFAFKMDPQAVYAKKIDGNTVEVADYSQESLCIPNPIDDYWCVLPQTTRVMRVWFLNGKAEDWYMVRCASYEGACNLEGQPEWQTPPDFDSPTVPSFVKQLRGQKQ